MTENCHFQLFLVFCRKFLELEMEYCYLGFFCKSRPKGENLLNISGVFHISHTTLQAYETDKNCRKIVCLVVFQIFASIFNT